MWLRRGLAVTENARRILATGVLNLGIETDFTAGYYAAGYYSNSPPCNVWSL